VSLPNKESQTVALALFERWFCRYGIPLEVFTDQGKEFCGELTKDLFRLMNVVHTTTSAYHPQCNAQSEVVNKTIAKYLASFVADSTLDWEQYLAPLMFVYNTSFHRSILNTPHMLTYGIEPRQPNLPGPDVRRKFYGESSSDELLLRLLTARDVARRNNEETSTKTNFDANKKTAAHNFQVDQLVLLDEHSFLHKNTKLAPNWSGPHRIVRLKNDNNVELKLKNGRYLLTHASRLKPYFVPTGDKNMEFPDNTVSNTQPRNPSNQIEPIPHKHWLRKLPPPPDQRPLSPPPPPTDQPRPWYEVNVPMNPNDPLSANFQGFDPDPGMVFHGFATPAKTPAKISQATPQKRGRGRPRKILQSPTAAASAAAAAEGGGVQVTIDEEDETTRIDVVNEDNDGWITVVRKKNRNAKRTGHKKWTKAMNDNYRAKGDIYKLSQSAREVAVENAQPNLPVVPLLPPPVPPADDDDDFEDYLFGHFFDDDPDSPPPLEDADNDDDHHNLPENDDHHYDEPQIDPLGVPSPDGYESPPRPPPPDYPGPLYGNPDDDAAYDDYANYGAAGSLNDDQPAAEFHTPDSSPSSAGSYAGPPVKLPRSRARTPTPQEAAARWTPERRAQFEQLIGVQRHTRSSGQIPDPSVLSQYPPTRKRKH